MTQERDGLVAHESMYVIRQLGHHEGDLSSFRNEVLIDSSEPYELVQVCAHLVYRDEQTGVMDCELVEQ